MEYTSKKHAPTQKRMDHEGDSGNLCEGKGVQTHKNQEQEFFLKRQVKNVWYGLCQEAWN